MLLTLLPGGPAHACAALRAAHGLAANETARLSAFRAALSTPPLSDTLAYAMASASLSYAASFAARCEGLNNGTVAALRSINASEASLVQQLRKSCAAAPPG